ncbi:hypothetical protein [Nonomuraea sp. NPDC050310]|uniref:hypothetical protein n=1 Tax=unclassified Nonomuraea TaxID=2593643 RepID=UPI0033D4F2FD
MSRLSAIADRLVGLLVPTVEAKAACTPHCGAWSTPSCSGGICCVRRRCVRSDCSTWYDKQCFAA